MNGQLGTFPGGIQAATPPPKGGSGGGTVTAVTGNAPITSTGGSTPAIGITAATDVAAGSMSAADKTKLDGITGGAAVAAVSGTSPITSTGGTTPTVGINNTGTTAGRADLPELIDDVTVSAVSTYTTPSWVAGKYKLIGFRFKGTHSGGYIQLQANADSALTYFDYGLYVTNTSSPAGDSVDIGSEAFARIAVGAVATNNTFIEGEFKVLKDGLMREGLAHSIAQGSAARFTGFGYSNTTTDITFLTFSITSGGFTFSGRWEVWGIPS